MANLSILMLVCALLAVMVVTTPPVDASCGPVQSYISSCFAWLHKIENSVKKECCEGVKRLDHKVKGNPTEAKSVCMCIRQYYQTHIFDTARADEIPKSWIMRSVIPWGSC
ncbi:hypothetical protein Droror1_Dr00004737 [Drosera rotundifolia]